MLKKLGGGEFHPARGEQIIDFFGYMTGAVVAVGIMLMIYKCRKIRIV